VIAGILEITLDAHLILRLNLDICICPLEKHEASCLKLNDVTPWWLGACPFFFADEWTPRRPEKWIRESMMSYLLSGCFLL
jgi:hypothetical protein